jgi:large conductance mechanosensitive channel
MWSELKAFLLRGDVITLAVAFIIGAAFNQIITSLVADVVTPTIGLIFGEPDFSNIAFFYEKLDENGKPVGGIQIGKFINSVISFLMVGTTLFFLIKAAGKKTEEVK